METTPNIFERLLSFIFSFLFTVSVFTNNSQADEFVSFTDIEPSVETISNFDTEYSEIEILPTIEPAAPSGAHDPLNSTEPPNLLNLSPFDAQPVEQEQPKNLPLSQDDIIGLIHHLSDTVYPDVDPYLVRAIVWKESRYKIDAVDPSGSYIGLMQIAESVHQDRMERLGVTDLFDPYQNIMVGMDLLNELYSRYEDTGLVLMKYNGQSNAMELFKQGKLTSYAESVMNKTEEFRVGDGSNA